MNPKEGPTYEAPKEKAEYISKYGGTVTYEGVTYAVAQDGELIVPIPDDIATHIVTMLRLHDKSHDEGDRDALAVLQTFNCRKSALVASGALDIEESILDRGDDSGVEAMFMDVDRLLADPDGSVVSLKDYADFESVLDSYEGSFPCIVHVFESEIAVPEEGFKTAMKTMPRVHSFVVLGQAGLESEQVGQGEEEETAVYVCFQKMGPALNEPFTITELSFITHLHRNQKDRIGYFVFGPYR